jgi:hypothetical protein
MGGRFCQPGDHKSEHRGLNRTEVFFCEMKTEDDPMLALEAGWYKNCAEHSTKTKANNQKSHAGLVPGPMM